jgi:hypothetical protein
VDPEFAGSANNNYFLIVTSPCIDAGDPDPAYNDPDGSRNDIGALPFVPLLYICGDANADSLVNIFDVTFMIAALYLGGPMPDPVEAADVNNDASFNIFDVTYLISFLYKGGPAPVCP